MENHIRSSSKKGTIVIDGSLDRRQGLLECENVTMAGTFVWMHRSRSAA